MIAPRTDGASRDAAGTVETKSMDFLEDLVSLQAEARTMISFMISVVVPKIQG